MSKLIKAVLRAIPWSFVFWVSFGVGVYITISTLISNDLSNDIALYIFACFVVASILALYFAAWLIALFALVAISYGITICALSDRFAWARMKWNEFIGEEL